METKDFIKQVKIISEICGEWLEDVCGLENETAYSDSLIDNIVSEAKKLEKMNDERWQ